MADTDGGNFLDDLVAKAKDLGEHVKEFAEDAFDNVKDFAADAGENIKEFTSDAGDNINDLAPDTGDNITDFAADAVPKGEPSYPADAVDAAKDKVDEVKDDLSN